MAKQTLQESQSTFDSKKSIVSNQEITSRRWKFDSIFKVIAGIIYGLFFGMLPATFIKNTAEGDRPANPFTQEICAIIGLMAVATLSIAIIFWVFRGDIKKKHPIVYWMTHILNSILLSVGIIVATIMYSDSTDINRYLVLAISYGGWAVIMGIAIFGIIAIYRKPYPLSWSRSPFAFFSLLFAGTVELFIYLAVQANNDGLKDQRILFTILALIAFVIAVVIFGFALAFVRRFRDVLLGERTEYEIDSIRDWESSRIMALIMSAAMVITYTVALIIKSELPSLNSDHLPLFIEIAVDAVFVVIYIAIITTIKIKNIKAANKNFLTSRIFRSIDNGLLLDIFGWIIVVKATLLQGAYLSEASITNEIKALMLLITFGSVLLLYGFTAIIQVNVPNLRNTAISLPTLAFTLILGVFVILFGGYIYENENPKAEMSNLIFVMMSVIALCGISISLIIKICIIAKIFKVNWEKQSTIDKSNLEKEQKEQSNDFLGEKTKEVDVEEIEQAKEAIKQGARG